MRTNNLYPYDYASIPFNCKSRKEQEELIDRCHNSLSSVFAKYYMRPTVERRELNDYRSCANSEVDQNVCGVLKRSNNSEHNKLKICNYPMFCIHKGRQEDKVSDNVADYELTWGDDGQLGYCYRGSEALNKFNEEYDRNEYKMNENGGELSTLYNMNKWYYNRRKTVMERSIRNNIYDYRTIDPPCS